MNRLSAGAGPEKPKAAELPEVRIARNRENSREVDSGIQDQSGESGGQFRNADHPCGIPRLRPDAANSSCRRHCRPRPEVGAAFRSLATTFAIGCGTALCRSAATCSAIQSNPLSLPFRMLQIAAMAHMAGRV